MLHLGPGAGQAEHYSLHSFHRAGTQLCLVGSQQLPPWLASELSGKLQTYRVLRTRILVGLTVVFRLSAMGASYTLTETKAGLNVRF